MKSTMIFFLGYGIEAFSRRSLGSLFVAQRKFLWLRNVKWCRNNIHRPMCSKGKASCRMDGINRLNHSILYIEQVSTLEKDNRNQEKLEKMVLPERKGAEVAEHGQTCIAQ